MVASLAVYLEFASYFPHRSGAEVAYLEKVSLMDPGSPLTCSRDYSGLPETEVPFTDSLCRTVGSSLIQ